MKRDLTDLLRSEEDLSGFEDLQSAKEYLVRYPLSYVAIELSGLPKEEWERTLKTWIKICAFAKSLLDKSEPQRRELYRKFNFDPMMEGIAEDLRKTFLGMVKLGLLKKEDPPHRLLKKALELVRGEEDLFKRWELDTEIVSFMDSFFKRMP